MGRITKTKFGLCVRSQFTNAQILTWPSQFLIVEPGLPGDRIWLVHSYFVGCVPFFADYTNIDPTARMGVNVGGVPGSEPAAAPIGGVGGLLVGNDVTRGWTYMSVDFLNGPTIAFSGGADAGAIAYSMTNGALGNFTGGDPGNVLNIYTFFSEFTLP